MSTHTKFPAIPDPRLADVTQVLDSLKENVEILTGRRGSADARAVLEGRFSNPDKRGAILLNGWTNFGSGYANAGFYVFGDGRIMLTGAITAPSTFSSVAFSLGRGFAPPALISAPALLSGGGVTRLDIQPVTGEVSFPTSFTGTVFLDGVAFVKAL